MDNLVTSNIRQRPIRTLVSVAGVALGVALVMLFTGLARGMSNDLQRRATNVRAELIFMRPGAIQISSNAANLDTRYVDRLKQIEGVRKRCRYFATSIPALKASVSSSLTASIGKLTRG